MNVNNVSSSAAAQQNARTPKNQLGKGSVSFTAGGTAPVSGSPERSRQYPVYSPNGSVQLAGTDAEPEPQHI